MDMMRGRQKGNLKEQGSLGESIIKKVNSWQRQCQFLTKHEHIPGQISKWSYCWVQCKHGIRSTI